MSCKISLKLFLKIGTGITSFVTDKKKIKLKNYQNIAAAQLYVHRSIYFGKNKTLVN